jgi:3-(3-hydroxy-phenyl)propionate hydroxylase
VKDALLRLVLRTPLRPLLTDVRKLRPRHRLRNGLVLRERPPRTCARPGRLFPQALVRGATGEILWSDEVLGLGLALVGMGVDPRAALSDAGRAAWERMGGRYVCLASPQQRLDPLDPVVTVAEDLTSRFLEHFGRDGLVAAVRPDRTVLGVCEHQATAAMVRDVEDLLCPPLARPAAARPEGAGRSEESAHAV